MYIISASVRVCMLIFLFCFLLFSSFVKQLMFSVLFFIYASRTHTHTHWNDIQIKIENIVLSNTLATYTEFSMVYANTSIILWMFLLSSYNHILSQEKHNFANIHIHTESLHHRLHQPSSALPTKKKKTIVIYKTYILFTCI